MFWGLEWTADALIYALIAGVGLVGLIALLVFDAVGDVDLPFLPDSLDFSSGVDLGPIAVNTQVLMAFLTAYGAGSWVATGYFDLSPVAAAFAGLAPGGVVAILASFGYRTFKRSEATSGFSLHEAVGLKGIVTLIITPDTPGRVSFTRGIESQTALAVTVDKSTISEGAQIEILGMSGPYLTVRAV